MNHVNRRTQRPRPRTLKRTNRTNWGVVIAALAVTGLVYLAWIYLGPRTNQAQTLKRLQSKESELTTKLEELNKSTTTTKELEETKIRLENEKLDLQHQLEAKARNRVYAEGLSKPAQAIPKTVVVSGSVEATIRSWAAHYGISGDYLMRIARCESGLRLDAYNKSGATGLFQFMPSTFKAWAPKAGAGFNIYSADDQAHTAAYMFANGQAHQWECK